MRTAAALVAAGLALASAGCGSDQRADFRSDLRSLDARVQRVGDAARAATLRVPHDAPAVADAHAALSRAASR